MYHRTLATWTGAFFLPAYQRVSPLMFFRFHLMTTSVSDKVASLYARYVAWWPDNGRGPVKSLPTLQGSLQGFLCEESELGHLDSYTSETRIDGFTLDEVHFLISTEAMKATQV